MNLSRRQREVCELLADGMETKVIANRLGIAPTSVKTHARKAFKKLGVTNRTQAAIEFLRMTAYGGA